MKHQNHKSQDFNWSNKTLQILHILELCKFEQLLSGAGCGLIEVEGIAILFDCFVCWCCVIVINQYSASTMLLKRCLHLVQMVMEWNYGNDKLESVAEDGDNGDDDDEDDELWAHLGFGVRYQIELYAT